MNENQNKPTPTEGGKAPETGAKKPMSRTKKRIILTAVILGVLIVGLIVFLIISSFVNNQPPALSEVKARFTLLIEASLDYNDLLWGEGLPTRPRIVKSLQYQTYTRPGGQETEVEYFLYPDAVYGEVVAYHYYLNAKVGDAYQLIDIEAEAKGEQAVILGGTPAEYYRYARRVTAPEGEDYIYTKTEGEVTYYYYAIDEMSVRLAPHTRPGGQETSIQYFSFTHAEHGEVVLYHYYLSEQKQDGTGYQLIDLEAEAKGEGAIINTGKPDAYYRYLRKTATNEGEGYTYTRTEGGVTYYYYPVEAFAKAGEPFFYTSSDSEDYDYVLETAPYQSTDEILDELADIYSADMLSAIEQSLFIGVTVAEGNVSYARYTDLEKDGGYYLGKLNNEKGLWREFRIRAWDFDYDTMEILSPSGAKSVTVSVCYDYREGARQEGDADITKPMKIRFALGDDGNWYLDSYTW